ncbi:hypothetical protein BDZ45DRAFT_224687 [Acephala macrosclerotiorum]|nr:hypothetical protein BDZ45DRAFT_224687 [Acephala macrosclerotiorum]
MLRGSTSPDTCSNAAADSRDETGNQKLGATQSTLRGVGLEVEEVEQGVSARSTTKSQTNSQTQPIKALMINEHAANPAPSPAQRPSGLPLRFIDQQELRQPSGSDLRKVVRSHARRDVDLKRRHIRDTLKALVIMSLIRLHREAQPPCRWLRAHRATMFLPRLHSIYRLFYPKIVRIIQRREGICIRQTTTIVRIPLHRI